MMLINLPSMPDQKKSFKKKSLVYPKTKPLYKYEFNPAYGCPRRVKSGEMDLHDYIQQSADDVDFKSIGKMLVDTRDNVIDHFSLNGEVMDVTKLPRNIHEYEQMHNTMLKEFNNLPAELKVLFQDDFNLFANAWKSGKLVLF